jgi:hypothetical protein
MAQVRIVATDSVQCRGHSKENVVQAVKWSKCFSIPFLEIYASTSSSFSKNIRWLSSTNVATDGMRVFILHDIM